MTNTTNKHILLVDDDDTSRLFMKQLLRKFQLNIDEANNGAESLLKIAEKDYDLVIMDIQMPQLKGTEVVRILRTLAEHKSIDALKHLPIIAMTAAPERIQLEAKYFNHILGKPIDHKILFSTVQAYSGLEHSINSDPQPIKALPSYLTDIRELAAQEAIYRLGGSLESYLKQLTRFANNHQQSPNILLNLMEENPSRAIEFCHSLRGVLSNLGAVDLARELRFIENELTHQRNIPSHTIENISRKLTSLIKKINRFPQNSPAASTLIDSGKSPKLLKLELLNALRYDISHAQSILISLQAALANSVLQAKIDDVAKEIDQFNLESAITTLKSIDLDLIESKIDDTNS